MIREEKTRIPYNQQAQEFEEIFEKIKLELGIKPKNNNKDIMEK